MCHLQQRREIGSSILFVKRAMRGDRKDREGGGDLGQKRLIEKILEDLRGES